MRIKHSFGKCHVNKGTCLEVKDERYVIDYSRQFFLFDVVPMGAPRMTQSDRWKTNPNHSDPRKRQRTAVTNYFVLKNSLVEQANEMKFELGKCVDAVFLMPMPQTWSQKKKDKMNGMPCESKPDTDNLLKGLCDALRKNDQDIWQMKGVKVWAFKGSIIVYQ
jgi:Holliday junction resolvase RusA-like endonuclease